MKSAVRLDSQLLILFSPELEAYKKTTDTIQSDDKKEAQVKEKHRRFNEATVRPVDFDLILFVTFFNR